MTDCSVFTLRGLVEQLLNTLYIFMYAHYYLVHLPTETVKNGLELEAEYYFAFCSGRFTFAAK